MGSSTEALVHISFNRETFDTIYKVEDYIEERNDEIETAKKTLSQLAWTTEPRKFCEEEESPEMYIKHNLEWALEQLEEAAVERYKAQLVYDAWRHMHHENGGALYFEGGFDAGQRLWGDFIVCVNADGSNAYPNNQIHTNSYNKMIDAYERRKAFTTTD